MSQRQLVIASKNPGKITEFERLLSEHALDITVLGLADFPNLPDVAETGSTFEENSLLKAHAIANFTGFPAIADDSGLCVDALDGAPGIFSARYAGEHGNDVANYTKLLDVLSEMKLVDPRDRTAHFTCAVVFVFPENHARHSTVIVEQGYLHGWIAAAPRGDAGFGYDPVFTPDGFELTLGEFGPGEKDRISHRGHALRAIAPRIVELL
jgi:XTP/dITP diphosphohydrolase